MRAEPRKNSVQGGVSERDPKEQPVSLAPHAFLVMGNESSGLQRLLDIPISAPIPIGRFPIPSRQLF